MLHHLKKRTPILFGFLVLYLGIFAGSYWKAYDVIPQLDKVFHVMGGVVCAWLALAFLQNEVTHLRPFKQWVIVVSVAMLIGTWWEVAEYVGNFTENISPTFYYYFHGGGLGDTIVDLVCDTLGASLFAVWAIRKERS
jgi:uncharacterized membrane protein YjdF